MSTPPPPRSEQNLSDEQKFLMTETLSQFDAKNLTESDAISIIETFSQAGIQPGSALETTMSDLGFDAKSVAELASVSEQGNRPPPPSKQDEEGVSSMVEYLTELMEEKLAASNSTELSDEDKQSILQQIFERYDVEDNDSIIDTTA